MLIGNIDAFERGKLFGWAYNPDVPAEHLQVRVRSGGAVVAEGRANLMRPDLPGSGVGAGDHAFELALPPIVKSLDGILITAHSASHGELVLSALPTDDHHLNAVLQIYTARYNTALAAMNARLEETQAALAELRDEAGQGAAPPPADVESRLQNLENRIDSIEVFLVRIDESLRQMSQALPKQRKWALSRIFSPGNG